MLELWGIDAASIIAGLGLFSVALALGAQNFFKNLIGGLLIIGEKRFKQGDWISVEGVAEGSVERIDAVAEIIKNASKSNEIIVVVSAMGGETNKLIKLSKHFSEDPDKREFDALVSTGETVSSALLAMALHSNCLLYTSPSPRDRG